MEVLFQGAESKIYITEYLGIQMLVKERFPKKYRNPQLDSYLTKERIKAECRNIIRCKRVGIKSPAIYFVNMEKNLIFMEYFNNSKTAKMVIDDFHKDLNDEAAKRSVHKLSNEIGKSLAKMHLNGIVHGDLTTSNILIANGEVIFIDFGLSSSNASSEDKGVDLYVLERALISTHANAELIFEEILTAYKNSCGVNKCGEVIGKFQDVRARGRKRTMVG